MGASETKYAISYIRYSTKNQKKGSSEERQITRSKEYMRTNNLVALNKTIYLDEGKSGYSQENLSDGHLGRFLNEIQENKIPKGTTLIIESMDRLSRAKTTTVIQIILNIVEAGIKIVILDKYEMVIDKKLLDSQDSTFVWGMLTAEINRAFGESKRKSELISKARELERQKARNGEGLISGVLPAWLSKNKEGIIFEVKERADVVRLIYTMYLDGKGAYTITKYLQKNVTEHPPFGCRKNTRIWHKSYINKLLNNHAVYGRCIPHTYDNNEKKRIGLQPIEDYYPAIISKEEFDKVQYIKAKKSIIEGETENEKTSRLEYRGRTGRVSNLLSGIIYCGICGIKMEMSNKGYGDNIYCRGGCNYKLNYGAYNGRPHFEEVLLKYLRNVDYNEVLGANNDNKKQMLKKEIDNLKSILYNKNKEQKNIANHLITYNHLTEQMNAIAKKNESEITKTKKKLETLEAELIHISEQDINNITDDLKILYQKLYDNHKETDVIEIRRKLRDSILSVVDRVNVHPPKENIHHGIARIIFKNQNIDSKNLDGQGIGFSWRLVWRQKPIREFEEDPTEYK